MKRFANRTGRGVTLVEMLVVVAIIGILAAILVPVVYSGLIRAKVARLVIEVGLLDQAMRQYKTEYGEYPPNFTNGAYTAASPNRPIDFLTRVFKRLDTTLGTYQAPPAQLDPAEALVFWLQGFGPDKRNPIAGTKVALFDFDKTRLKDTDGDTFFEYYPKEGRDAPYVYIHNSAYATLTHSGMGQGGTIRAYRSDSTATVYANQDTYQIICAGLDGDYGSNTSTKTFPSGAGYNPQDRDNVTNFGDGKTLEDNQD